MRRTIEEFTRFSDHFSAVARLISFISGLSTGCGLSIRPITTSLIVIFICAFPLQEGSNRGRRNQTTHQAQELDVRDLHLFSFTGKAYKS